MRYILIVLVIFSSIFAFSSCNNENPTNQQNDQPSIIYKNLPCDNIGLEKPSDNKTVDFTWTLNSNILNLDFRYDAVCGSIFSDKITYLGNVLSVNLKDTSSVHYYCYCNFGTQVSLNISNENQVRLKFSLAQFDSNNYHLLLDTLLVVKLNP